MKIVCKTVIKEDYNLFKADNFLIFLFTFVCEYKTRLDKRLRSLLFNNCFNFNNVKFKFVFYLKLSLKRNAMSICSS